MTDLEIKEYLIKNNWQIKASDGISKIFNTSHQITDEIYDYETQIMTIKTANKNTFRFKWILGNPCGGKTND